MVATKLENGSLERLITTKMKIAIVCDSVGLQSVGSLISAWRYATNLAKRGHKIVLITTGKEYSVKTSDGVKVFRFKALSWPGTNGGWRMTFFLNSEKIKKIFSDEKIELVHVMLPTPLCFSGIIASKKLRLPLITHSHTQPENLFMVVHLNYKPLNAIFYKYLKWFYSKSNLTICPSKFAESKLHMYGFRKKTIVISNGVELNEFKIRKVSDEFYKKFNLDKSDKRILFVGRLSIEKNAQTLIKAMPYVLKKIEKVHLDVVGKKQLYYSKLNKITEELGIKKHISFLGRVSDKDLNNAYNACDIFCLPSFVELEGMVVLEAMATGKPIIISNAKESASKYYVDKNGYLFKVEDPKDLANKLIKILSSKAIQIKMGKQSLKIVKSLSMDKCIDKLESVYSELIKKYRK